MWHDWGNPPINSTSAPSAGGASTTALLAELDSTQLGTKDLGAGQKLMVSVNWTVSSDTVVTLSYGSALSTGMGSTGWVNRVFVDLPGHQAGQFVTRHELFTNYRLRGNILSSVAGTASMFISAVVET
jgi:hypothetical protein